MKPDHFRVKTAAEDLCVRAVWNERLGVHDVFDCLTGLDLGHYTKADIHHLIGRGFWIPTEKDHE